MSWYLDAVSEHWDALVMGDYEAVMPLPWKKKFGLRYIIQPVFLKTISIYGEKLNRINHKQFFKAIPSKFVYINLLVDYPDYASRKGVVQYVDLREPVNYNKSTRKNLRKAQRNNLLAENAKNNEFLKAIENSNKAYFTDTIKNACSKMLANEMIVKHSNFIKVLDEFDNVISFVWLLNFKGRLTLIASDTTESGKQLAAKFFEQDYVIQHFKKKHHTLDFAGSILPGVRSFNLGFGAKEYEYTFYRRVFNYQIRVSK
jgi:hypothetical protein